MDKVNQNLQESRALSQQTIT